MSEMQALLQQAREMLASQGAPVTTENLNRAMLALSQNQSAPADGFDMNAQVDRVMQRSTGRPGQRANVPRNAQPNAPVGVTGAAGTAPDENAVPDMTLPMPPPDINAAAQEAGQRQMIIPGEGIIYSPTNTPTSSLDGNGMQNRFLRDLVMGAESAGAVSGMLPPTMAAGNAGRAAPTTQTLPRLSADELASIRTQGGPIGNAPTAPAAPPSLSPAQQRALAGPDLPPGTPSGLTPRQRATLMGPGQAGDAAFKAARVREGGPRGQSSRAAQQRASNRSNASN